MRINIIILMGIYCAFFLYDQSVGGTVYIFREALPSAYGALVLLLYYGINWITLWQLLYVIPLFIWLHYSRRKTMAKGVIVGEFLVSLVSVLVFISLAL
ncbi:MAG: hypothetical protein AAF821_04420 [Cyanobacteria bacterium P01_D01_bin.156]